jgi:hypothetical protein
MKAILTGHSRGLGAAIAAELLARGIAVLGLSRVPNHALATRYPTVLQHTDIDLSDPLALGDWIAGGAMQRFLDGADSVVLINNAGAVHPVGPLGGQGAAAIARAVSLNIAAPLMLADALVAASPGARERRILHVSSGAGRNAYPGWNIYCASKAALDHHARAVALDGTPGLKICSLAPGVIDTDMQADIRAVSLEQFPLRQRFENMKKNGDLAAPADCAARLVTYVLSERFGTKDVADLREQS